MAPILVGQPRPLGATWTRQGVNFAVFSSRATRIEVCLYDSLSGREQERFALPGRTGDIWHGLVPLRRAGFDTHYAYSVHGADEPQSGNRFDASAPLVDPYARGIAPHRPPRCRVIDPRFDWRGDAPPNVPWAETVLYELHVKGYTMLHPAVPERLRGKYLGLAERPVIEHLGALGVTAVELLPCQAFLSEQFLLDRGLVNYWGYNSLAWFSPASDYAVDDAVVEFKTMVKALHAARIEVILDVVFNHTVEGSETGPMLSWRGIDNHAYYRLIREDPRYYENLTGCGNTVNCEHPAVRTLIVDCLKYWVEEMHVDGFRFDLATVLAREAQGFNEHSPFFKAVRAEPALASVKLIAEPWDIGPGGYQLGRFPPGWSEWNDRYRDTVRGFWRGDGGNVGEFAERIAGSSDLFRHNGRKPTASVNFVTAHDGFTLRDLVCYNDRHNEANLENNADGTCHNLSWNCGAEGPTGDVAVNAVRRRQMRNFLATLFLSQGVPMLQAGDEFARTQGGNNNAYCQDNAISWVDWRLREANAELVRFVQALAALRRKHAEFRRDTFLKGVPLRRGAKDVAWLHASGAEMAHEDWLNGELRTLGVWLGRSTGSIGHLLLLLNASSDAQPFVLPGLPAANAWAAVFDTALEPFDSNLPAPAARYPLQARSVALLEC